MCDLEWVKPQPPPSLLLVLEPVQSCLGVARVMSKQKVRGAWNNALWSDSSLEKTSCLLKFTTDSNNSMGKNVSHGPVCLSGVSASERAESAWGMNRMIVGREQKRTGKVMATFFWDWQGVGYPCRLSDRC